MSAQLTGTDAHNGQQKEGRLTVLHIITRMVKGGAQEETLSAVLEVDPGRYRSILATGPSTGPEGSLMEQVYARGTDVRLVPWLVREVSPLNDLRALLALVRLFRAEQPAIVHTHTSKAGILGRLAARIARVPVIIHTPQGHIFHGYYGKFKTSLFIALERWCARYADRLVMLTENERNDHLALKIAPPDKFVTIHSGVDLSVFVNATPRRGVLREPFGISSEAKLIGTMGRLVPIKGQVYLIEAMPMILEHLPEAHLVLIGSGELLASLQQRARELRIEGHVHFAGYRTDLPDCLYDLDVFVLPSVNEGMGRVLVEAMAMRLPVVASDVCGIRDLVHPGENGELVSVGDPASLAQAIVGVLSDPERARRMGENGFHTVVPHYSLESMIAKIEALYGALLSAPPLPDAKPVAAQIGQSGQRRNIRTQTDQRITVLHVITRMVKGGAQQNTLESTLRVDSSRYRSILATGPSTGPEGSLMEQVYARGTDVRLVPWLVREVSPLNDLRALLALVRLFRAEQPAIVHTHTSKAGILGRLAARIARVPVIIHTPQGHIFHGYFSKLKTGLFIVMERWCARYADRLVMLTENERNDHLALKIAPPDKFVTIHSGVDLSVFVNATPRRGVLREPFGISSEAKLIGTMGRLVPIKGQVYLIEAMPMILEHLPEAHLVLIGSGELLASLQQRARELRIEGHVHFAGYRTDLPDCLYDLDVFVLPSLNEGMGRVLVEAMAMRLPVVASDVCGIRDLVHSGENGELAPVGDPASLAQSIVGVLSDPERARRMGENGLRTVVPHYSLESMVTKLENLYADETARAGVIPGNTTPIRDLSVVSSEEEQVQ